MKSTNKKEKKNRTKRVSETMEAERRTNKKMESSFGFGRRRTKLQGTTSYKVPLPFLRFQIVPRHHFDQSGSRTQLLSGI
jgi:hypothetical protein